MTWVDWLMSPPGVELTHAVVLLVAAIAGYFSYLAHRQTDKNAKLLNSHLAEHMRLANLLPRGESQSQPDAPLEDPHVTS